MSPSNNHIHLLPPAAGVDEPTVGTIKRALHDLSHAPAGSEPRDYAAVLREINELMRRMARINGVDPDLALRRRRDAAQSQRERMRAGSAATGRKST
jgi:hypothetical protein